VTPAIVLLEKSATPHEVCGYHHDPRAESYGTEAADVLGLDAAVVFKTLLAVVDGPRAETVVAVLPVSHLLDLKALAKAAGAKKATMAEPAQAERLTGYVVGGISPLGQRKRLRTFIDTSARTLGTMYVSAGKRGLEVALAPDDLAALLDGSFADLCAGSDQPGAGRRDVR
jgi:Cys-tRNA(Pro)/Cys-tRNA(Cys) deacylase